MPYYADGGRRAGGQGSARDRSRLATFAAADVFARTGGDFDGVGFAFLPGDCLVGIDLDGIIDPVSGEVSPRCSAIIEACASYTEFSPSGKGVHIICRGDATTTKSNRIGVEVFAGRQYFTFTGRRWPGSPFEVAALDDAVVRRLSATVRAARGGQPSGAAQRECAPAADVPRQEVFGGRERSLAETVALVEEALACLAPDDYEQWIAIGMACKAGLGTAGYYVWDEWSARSEKYAGAEDTRRRYQGFQPSKISLGSVFGLARDAGWVAPWDRARTRQRRVGPAPATGDAKASVAGSAPVASDSPPAAGVAAIEKKPRARAKAPAGGGGGGGGYGDDGGDTGDGDGDGDGEGHGWARGLVRKNGARKKTTGHSSGKVQGISSMHPPHEVAKNRLKVPISGDWCVAFPATIAIWVVVST